MNFERKELFEDSYSGASGYQLTCSDHILGRSFKLQNRVSPTYIALFPINIPI
jgi:hypothetical protein